MRIQGDVLGHSVWKDDSGLRYEFSKKNNFQWIEKGVLTVLPPIPPEHVTKSLTIHGSS